LSGCQTEPSATARPGYGTSVIRQLLPHQLGGAVELTFTADGVHCHLELPLAAVRAADLSVGVNDKDTNRRRRDAELALHTT
jgi:hypothetical protein